MRKHIFGVAVFALIVGSAVFAHRLFYPTIKPDVHYYNLSPNDVTGHYPVIQPKGFARDIYTIKAESVVADVKSKKVYVGINELPSSLTKTFVKTVIFAEDSPDMPVFETRWTSYITSSNLVLSCDGCAAMTAQKNYYARVYFAKSTDDENFRLRLKNERSGDWYLQSTPVLVSSGKR